MAKWLTKSDYAKFLIHPAYLWIAKHAKDKLPPFGEVDQAIVDQGNAVEHVAQQLWPNGYLITVPMFDGPDESAKQMRTGGPRVLFQPSVLTDRKLYVRSDVMVRQGESWDLYEIKASVGVKTAHLIDLAFQRLVWEESGQKIARCFVVHINPDYQSQGTINPKELFTIIESTDNTELLLKNTALKISEALAVIELPSMPDDAPELAGDWFGYRNVYRHLHPDIELDSILNLTRLSMEQINTFSAADIFKISNIPSDFPLKSQQQTQVEAVRAGRPLINQKKINASLNTLSYPLYFLDYETFASALPLYDNVKPYQQLPFQYSLDIIPAPGRQLIHREYLAQGRGYPILTLLAQLARDIGSTGSVIVWNQSFEMTCNDAMATLHPEYGKFLADVNARVYDLMQIFANGWYADAQFKGSASIKQVLPVLVPDLSYIGLGISEGMTAQIRWMKAARGELTNAQMQQLYDDLLEYCGQDTLAMVKIFEKLSV